jgi:hypothetical protein
MRGQAPMTEVKDVTPEEMKEAMENFSKNNKEMSCTK